MTMEKAVIIVNGVAMTQSDFNAYRKAHSKKKATTTRKKRAYTEVDYTKEYITSVVNKLSVLNSILAYDRNAYRQWGTVANLILGLKPIQRPFNKACIEIRKLKEVFGEIQNTRSKAYIKDLVYKFTWRLDDVSTALQTLIQGIKASEIQWSPMGCRECVVGNGRRLGLMTICYKAEKAIVEIKKMNEQLMQIVENM